MRPAIMKDVASRAGVSMGTVSNVLNRPEPVSDSTRQKVRRYRTRGVNAAGHPSRSVTWLEVAPRTSCCANSPLTPYDSRLSRVPWRPPQSATSPCRLAASA